MKFDHLAVGKAEGRDNAKLPDIPVRFDAVPALGAIGGNTRKQEGAEQIGVYLRTGKVQKCIEGTSGDDDGHGTRHRDLSVRTLRRAARDGDAAFNVTARRSGTAVHRWTTRERGLLGDPGGGGDQGRGVGEFDGRTKYGATRHLVITRHWASSQAIWLY